MTLCQQDLPSSNRPSWQALRASEGGPNGDQERTRTNLEKAVNEIACHLLQPESQKDFRERLREAHPDYGC